MTTTTTVEVDQAQLKDAMALFEFLGLHAEDALRIAINKTAPKVKTAAGRRIREQVRLQASYVNERLVVKKATRLKLSGSIGTPSRGLLLSRFSTDATVASDKVGWIRPPAMPKRGIFVKVKPNGAAKRMGNAFYVVLNGGFLAIAAREGAARKPFKVFRGPSLSQVFNTVRADVLPDAGDELTKQMADAMRYLLQKRFPPEGDV